MSSSSKKEWQRNTLKAGSGHTGQGNRPVETSSGLDIDVLYTPDDLAKWDYLRDVGYPGEYPFTRGVQPNMYQGRLWTMRQYAGFASAEESNRRYHYLLEQGQTGLSVAFDLPTQTGYDSDHPLAQGEVGKVGVPIDSLVDMEILLRGIPLEKVSTSMTINATASILLALYIAVAKKQGVGPEKISGTIQNDILKEYIARGTYIYPPKPSMRLVTDVFAYCSKNVPKWNTISVSGYHMREAGCTAIQEIAFTLADGIAYVESALEAGLNIDNFAGRLSFFFASYNDLLEEVAKFRAARRMWAKIMRGRFKAKEAKSWMLRFHTQTAGVTLTAQQPENNVIRCTIQALAAILGGTQSLHVNSKDEALALPTEEAVQLSLRTQQVIAYESGVADSVDPLAGSYYLEAMTNRLEEEAWNYIKRIDQIGGAVTALEQGFQMIEIQDSAYKHQQEVEEGKRLIVGVNKYVSESPPIKTLKMDPSETQRQVDRLNNTRRERDNAKCQASLKRLRKVAESNDNTLPPIIECVEAYATVGEICDVLRGVFGEQRQYSFF